MSPSKKGEPTGIAKTVLDAIEKQGPKKKARSLFLTTENYERLKEACERLETTPSAVIDQLIAQFLDQLGDTKR